MSETIFCLMGPTASGKTDLACELVKRYPFEIISVDSAMIYKEMNIGTAKPTAQELIITPHHLIDIINPNETYSAAQFCTDTVALCHDIFARGKIPLLVGGTMMYFNALQKGLSVLPEANAEIRNQLELDLQRNGLQALHQRLIQVDPEAGARIHAHDSQRIQRALEVYFISGKPMSDLLRDASASAPFRFVNWILFPERRAWLHERIAQRFDIMLDQGLVEEVKGLRNRWPLQDDMPSMRCVGYRQVIEFLDGLCDYSALREKGIAATRQLAKRQLTWLRHWEEGRFFDPEVDAVVDLLSEDLADLRL